MDWQWAGGAAMKGVSPCTLPMFLGRYLGLSKYTSMQPGIKYAVNKNKKHSV